MDVTFAFNGTIYIEEGIYVKQPLGYIVVGQEDKVLKFASYGLKQALRV